MTAEWTEDKFAVELLQILFECNEHLNSWEWTEQVVEKSKKMGHQRLVRECDEFGHHQDDERDCFDSCPVVESF